MKLATLTPFAFLLATLLVGPTATAQQNPSDVATPGYNTKIPEYIMTPDKVDTRIGTLEFFDGIPTKETAALLYENLDFLRGVEAFLNGVPATSIEGIRLGMERLGLTKSNEALIFDDLMDSNPLFLTGNTSSKYAWGYLNADGNYLDGGKTYKLNIPKDAPAKQFISICLYDPQTRSLLQTDQPLPSYSSARDKDSVTVNDDGSVDLYFGPKAPAGKENNWRQTVPGKGWFCLLRLYSPTEA